MNNKSIKKLENDVNNDSEESYDEKLDIHDPKNPKKGCTKKHPPLIFEMNNTKGVIYGSACAFPIFNADLFISLDEAAPVFEWEQPWSKNVHNQKHIRYFIKDFSVPDNAQEFDACVDTAINVMSQGKTVHVGCLSGHGRTGMFLSAVTHKILKEELKDLSAIDYVRDNYCAKVVETLEQVLFLYANYSIGVPIKEKKEIDFIKKEFKKQIGLSLDKVIELGQYNLCSQTINDLEVMMLNKKAFKLS